MSAYLDRKTRTVGEVLTEKGYQFVWVDAPDDCGWGVSLGEEAVTDKLFDSVDDAVNAALVHYGESK